MTPPSPINASPGCVLRSLEPKYNAPIQFQAWATCEKVGKSGRLLNLAYDKDGPSDEAEARKQGKSSKWCYVSSAGSQNVVETCADSANGTLPLNLNAGDYTCLGTSRDILGLARTQVQRDVRSLSFPFHRARANFLLARRLQHRRQPNRTMACCVGPEKRGRGYGIQQGPV